MKQITLKLLFCFALLLPALAGNAADITEDFSSNSEDSSWMPYGKSSASSTPATKTSPTTGLEYTICNVYANSSFLMITKNSGYIEVTLPIACSGVEISTPNNSIGSGAGFTITATSTTDDSATSTTIGSVDLTSKNSTITYDFVKDANKQVQPAGTKFKFAAGSGNTQVTKIKFVEYVEQEPSTDPELSVFKESYDFGTVLAGKQSAATSVKLEAANLTEDISVSVDNDAFTLSATSIALAKAADGIDVTFAPTEAKEENYSATLTFTSGELTATTTLTGICPVVTGDGTHDNPFTVADVILLNNGLDQTTNYFVKGIISDSNYKNSALQNVDIVNSNLGLTDGVNTIPVELKANTDMRTALNISDHPENIKGTLLVEGVLTAYFNLTGVKSITSNYELELYKEPVAVDRYVIYSADALAENEEQINTGDWQTWYNVANELVEDTTSPEGAAQRLYHGESGNNYVMGWTILKENFSATKLFTTTEEGSEAYDVVFMAKSSDASESYYVNLPANGDHFNYFTLPANEWTEIRVHAPEVVSEYWATDPDVFQVGIGANGVSTADNALYFCNLHFEPADHSNDQAWEAGKTFWGIQSGTTPFNGIDYPYYLRYSITTNEDKTLTTTSEWTGLDALGGLVKPQFSVDVADSKELFMNCGENDPVDNVYTFKTSIARDVDQTLLVWYYYPYTGNAIRPENIFYVTCSENEKPELPVQLVITAEVDNLIGTAADIRYTVYPAAYAENCTVSIEGEGTAEQQDGYFAVSGLTKNTEYSYTLKVNDATDANAVEGTATVTFTTPTSDGVDQISADSVAAEYYNLQGIRVTNPVQGQIYIKKQNQKATKVAF